jgi:hypothetical protein
VSTTSWPTDSSTTLWTRKPSGYNRLALRM